MRIVLFYHSVLSDWNNGHVHFLRGITSELIACGHDVQIFEPRDAWSVEQLIENEGSGPIWEFHEVYPDIQSTRYDLRELDLDDALHGAELVIAHEWNNHALIERLDAHRSENDHYRLLFHDTHHRAATVPHEIEAYELDHFDGVLAFGEVIRKLYVKHEWARRAWTWHEAADTRHFYPRKAEVVGDVVWIGNWGDEERSQELREFFIEPVKELGLQARAYGVRYPESAQEELAEAGIEYAGWLPNFRVPEVFSRFRATLHIPRRPYAEALPGIPTIRPFEALSCGIPLVCSPWRDAEGLFSTGEDFLMAHDGAEMKRHLESLMADREHAAAQAELGLQAIQDRHTCAHRVDQLMDICRVLGLPTRVSAAV